MEVKLEFTRYKPGFKVLRVLSNVLISTIKYMCVTFF